MKESSSNKRLAYKLIKVSENKYQLCKVLNEYNSQQEADAALLDLLTNVKTEKQIIKDYLKKDIL